MLIAPVIALLSGYLPLWCFVLVFVAQGVIQDGMWMVFSSAVLETVRPEERPFAVGVSSLFQLPAAFYGVLGGLLSQYLGYPAAFAVALGFALAGLAVASSGPVTRAAAETST
jgi:MFS family permease